MSSSPNFVNNGIGQPKYFIQKDGAKTAYEILGEEHATSRTPIVLVGGMFTVRGDWDRIARMLSINRTVVIYDHRGIGDSTFSPNEDEEYSIELLARDLLALVTFLGFKQVAICGFSMGGVVTQQLLFLPHLSAPTHLPFRITHVMLTGTLTLPLNDKRYGAPIIKPPPGKKRTFAEKREIVRPTLEASFDPEWLADPQNTKRLNWWLDRMAVGRPLKTVLKQGLALRAWSFEGLYEKMSRDFQILVIHGDRDEIVPFYCAQEILRRFPWARMVEIGQSPGQVENLAFGHTWWEYFDARVWTGVFERFLGGSKARL